jgi:hypothetical protein
MDENIESKIRYLEMIQSIMAKMSSNSFMLKGWAVTLVAGVFALSAKDANSIYFLIAYIPVILFWFLDSYYLMLERQYKHFYDIVTDKKSKEIDFKIKRPKPDKVKKTCYAQCLFSKTEVFFYVPTALLITIVVTLSHFH